MIGNDLKVSYTGIFLVTHFTLSKNFWSSAETIDFINYFCCNLYCIVLLLCYAQYLILETSRDFTFMLPYIVIDFFLNNQPGAPVIQIYSVIRFYIFRASSLPIIRNSLLYIRHWFHAGFDDSFQAESGWNSILTLLVNGHQKPA